MGRQTSNKQGNGYKTDGNFLASHTFIPSDASDYQVMGEGSKGGQTWLIFGISLPALGVSQTFEIRSEALPSPKMSAFKSGSPPLHGGLKVRTINFQFFLRRSAKVTL